jgi:WD40 repeat protein
MEHKNIKTKRTMRTAFLLLFLYLASSCLHTQKGNIVKNIPTDLPVSCIKLSPDHEVIAIADDTEDPLGFQELKEEFKIIIISSSDYRVKFKMLGHQESIESINFSPDSKRLISTDKSGVIKLWDLTNGKEILSIKTDEWVHNAKFSSSGNEFIAIQGYNKVALLYDIEGSLILNFQVDKQINDFDFNPESNQIYFGCHDEFQVWSLVTRKLISRTPFKGLMCMSFNNAYSQLAVGTSSGDILLFTPELKEVSKLKGHFKPVLSISFSFDDKKIASASSDQTARIWDLQKESEILQLTNEHKGTVSAIEFISDNYEFMTGGVNKELKVWK